MGHGVLSEYDASACGDNGVLCLNGGAYAVFQLGKVLKPLFLDYFVELFASAIEAAKKNNTELYCGEYGVIDVVSPEDTLKWYKIIHRVLDNYGIARAAWSYKEMDFGLSDARLDSVRNELLWYL